MQAMFELLYSQWSSEW